MTTSSDHRHKDNENDSNNNDNNNFYDLRCLRSPEAWKQEAENILWLEFWVFVSPAKTAEPLEMPFGVRARVGQESMCYVLL